MGYTFKDWTKRIRNRSDLSNYLTHLTRESENANSLDNLLNILNERRILGSTTNSGFIIGDNSAVCFQDAPLYSVCQNTYYEQLCREESCGKTRYKPMGVSFSKRYVYLKGGRPVIYDKKEDAKEYINRDEWWRIVSFDLTDTKNIIDWTHEREWRVKGDFDFDLNEATVLLVSQKSYKKFIKMASPDILDNIGGIVVLESILT